MSASWAFVKYRLLATALYTLQLFDLIGRVVVRRLRELAADGILEVQIRRGHAHYRLIQADATLF